MATNPSMSGSKAARERSILARLRELQTSIDAVSGGAFGGALLHVQDEKSSGTNGGTFTQDAYRTRDLNQVKTNEITGASLSSNKITLPTGTYYIEASAPGRAVSRHKAKLYDTTNSIDLVIGTSAYNFTSQIQTISLVEGRFTLSDAAVLELQHRCSSTLATTGFGVGSSFGEVEIYTVVKIWRVG